MTSVPRVGQNFGRYRLERLLGQGGMGMVFLATDTLLQRQVALKVMSGNIAGQEEFLQRFHREANVLARLNSPHITQIFDHGEHDGVPFIATQYLPGGDLGELVRKRGPMPVAIAVDLCAQVAAALHDAHRAGVVHRDVKPANVLVRDPDTNQPRAYLCDFGIAQTEQEGLTVAGGVAGTWAYLAPERSLGAPATPASDIYALGCLFWAALTGRPPYGGTDVQIALAHRNAPVPRFNGTDETAAAVNRFLDRAMAKDPAQRFPTAEAMGRAMTALGGSARTGFDPADVDEYVARVEAPRRTRRRRTPLVVGALALAVLAGGGIWWAQAGPGTDGGGDEPTAEPEPTVEPEPAPVVGDLDGDGYGDLELENDDSADILGLRFSGTADATKMRSAKVSPIDSRQILADFDGNGLPDIGKQASETLTVTFDSGRTAAFRLTTGEGDDSASLVVAGDYDGDGTDDLALVFDDLDDGPARITVLLNRGNRFAKGTVWAEVPISTFDTDFAVGDFDGDGDDDLAATVESGVRFLGTTSDYDARLTLLRAEGTRFVPAARAPESPDPYDVTLGAADVDGDGSSELLVYTSGFDADRLRTWQAGDEGFTPGSITLDAGTQSQSVLLATSDVDGNGHPDVLLVPKGMGRRKEISVALSDGTTFGSFSRWAACTQCGYSPSPLDSIR
ncbi:MULTISPECIES: serine/threonine-protein kinase [unclassified Nocardioides]|uniref:serine/threonine-protein kinase n=1 Tax=unclassified Nocardioides TaxID=2615069 RepID=UPI000701EA44|nr:MULTISPECIES: serine/threonine-protein kinase [unclassified Nocardioides]KQY57019.1 hypothetical protein ASD30_12200 [Nocardioides sp. Root140]KRF13143.1 hypothetical protein ASH02_16845 [Nocardioides sp. Soil796]